MQNEWAFFSGPILFATWHITCRKVCSPKHTSVVMLWKMATWLCSASSYYIAQLLYFLIHVFTVPRISSVTMNVSGIGRITNF